jgi:SSS family solute:Na+ symporter
MANPRLFDLLSPQQFSIYVTLAVGSAFALFLYSHTLTGVPNGSSQMVVKRNMVLPPIVAARL